MVVDFSNPGDTVVKPCRLAHIFLQTSPSQLKAMVQFYQTFLNASIRHQNDFLAFLSYDDEHHRIAVCAMPDTTPRQEKAAGMRHVAFTFNSLTDLALAYLQRKAHGIEPYWCVNHGPTTSMYYYDPDGNGIEAQVDNFDTAEEANDFILSPYFAKDPIGTKFDPQELLRRLEAGEDQKSIKKRPDVQ